MIFMNWWKAVSLRLFPRQIKRYQKIIANRDALLADAEDQANAIRDRAREEAKQMVNENEITRQAYEQAGEIMQNAQESAETMLREANAGALIYTNDILAEVEKVLANAYEESRIKTEETVSALKHNLDVVLENRRELNEQLEPQQRKAEADRYQSDDFDFDENTFLPDMEE